MKKSLRILFVDESGDCVEPVLGELWKEGFDARAERVGSTDGVVGMLESESWDALVLNASSCPLRVGDLREITRDLGLEIPIFVFSCESTGEEMAGALKAGAVEFLRIDELSRLVPAIEREITESRRRRQMATAERALRESESMYRLLSENMTDVVWTMDRRMRFVYFSPSVEKLIGLKPQEALSRRFSTLIGEDSLARIRKLNCGCFAEGESGAPREKHPIELELIRKDNTSVWTETVVDVLRDGENGFEGLLGVTRDISSRKNLELQLYQAQKMEAIGRLAGGVAHDFNNMLQAVTACARRIMENQDEIEPPEELAHQILKAGEKAAELTRRLLALGSRQPLKWGNLDLNSVVRGMEPMLRSSLGEDIDLVPVLLPEAGSVTADRTQLEQVVMNLAINARDAMPDGGRLVIKTENARLENPASDGFRYLLPGDYSVLSVSDTGCGMNDEVKLHLFEPFFTTKEKGAGSGLGLSIIYGIVKQIGGEIRVCSAQGKGTEFRIFLPVSRGLAETVTAGVDSFREETGGFEDSAKGSGGENDEARAGTILLVEDEDLVRNITRLELADIGYTVLSATSPMEALLIAGEFDGKIDLLLTDIVLPGMCGVALYGKMKESIPDLGVIYMSGYSRTQIDRFGLPDSPETFIGKPFKIERLVEKIEGTLVKRNKK